jgi:hypothetical protein
MQGKPPWWGWWLVGRLFETLVSKSFSRNPDQVSLNLPDPGTLLSSNPVVEANPTVTANTQQVTLYHADCLDVLAAMDEASIDAAITDPRYATCFRGHDWDREHPNPEIWKHLPRRAATAVDVQRNDRTRLTRNDQLTSPWINTSR